MLISTTMKPRPFDIKHFFLAACAVSLLLPLPAHASETTILDDIAVWFDQMDRNETSLPNETPANLNTVLTNLESADPADLVVVHKKLRNLELWRDGKIFKTYRIALGFTPVGPKHEEGDGKTPEGLYLLTDHNQSSNYHLSIKVDYPSPADLVYADQHHLSPGGAIMIHGQPNDGHDVGYPNKDWTDGCIAVSDSDIEDIWNHVAPNTPIMIAP